MLIADPAQPEQKFIAGGVNAAFALDRFDQDALRFRSVIALSTACKSLNGKCLNPASNGANPCFTFSWPVAEIPAIVRP